MSAPSRSRIPRAVLGALTGSVLVVTTVVASDSAQSAPAARGNPTGTAAGSPPNGKGYLAVSLATTDDGQIRVSWKRPGPASRFTGFDVRVGVNWRLTTQVRHYKVSRKKQSIVVPPAFGATSYSGNFSFVRVGVRRSNGTRGTAATKWIQTPLAAGCPSGGDRATIGTFNVRTWAADVRRGNKRFNWSKRGPRVVRTILRSGAHAVAIQEATGRAGNGHGKKRQSPWILAHLNTDDPDRDARWRDALPEDSYRGDGHVGTRVFYDANRFDKLASGFDRIPDKHAPTAYAPWVRLRGKGGSTSPFVLVSTHLANTDSRRAFNARNREIAKVIDLTRRLRSSYGGQVVLAGDFNSTVDIKPYNGVQVALLRAGFYDAFASARIVHSAFATTNSFKFPVRRSPHRRDYIMTTGGALGSCRYVNHAYRSASRAASDHFMQTATVPVSAG
jgi:endonuclease/exonuclease/phosphatase family metal-dependent hydrolase